MHLYNYVSITYDKLYIYIFTNSSIIILSGSIWHPFFLGSVWQVQHFGCLGLIFRGRRNTLQTSTKISARNLAKTHFLCTQCFVKI